MGLEIWFKDDLGRLLQSLYHANIVAGVSPRTAEEIAFAKGYAAALQGVWLAIGFSAVHWQDIAIGLLREKANAERYALPVSGQ